MIIKIQFVLLSVVLFSAFMVLIPSIDDAFSDHDKHCTPQATVSALTPCNIMSGEGTSEIISVFFLDGDDNGWAVGGGGKIFHTSTGGITWTSQTSNVASTLNSVHFTDNQNGWAVGVGGIIIHTSDGGNTWTVQSIDSDNSKSFYLYFVYFNDMNHGMAITPNGILIETVDSGVTWTVKSTTIPSGLVKFSFDVDSIILAETANPNVKSETAIGDQYVSIDGGSNWIDTVYTTRNSDVTGSEGESDSPTITFCGKLESVYNVITGTDNADYLKGTSGPDLIKGLGGNDFIRGGAGDDCILGGNGNDFIQGGAGSDTIYGDNGDDVVRTGGGDDTVYGGAGDDIINAAKNNGDKTFDGGEGDDMCIMSHGGDVTRTNCETTSALHRDGS